MSEEGFHFVLGHALYMKAIHGGKSKNDRIDAHKIGALLRGGNISVAYVYPPEMRATRDLSRRRTHLVRKRPDLFPGSIVRRSVELDLAPMESCDPLITQ